MMGCRGKKKEKDLVETESDVQKSNENDRKKERKEEKEKIDKEKKEREKKEKKEKKEREIQGRRPENEHKVEKQQLGEVDPESLVQIPVEDVVRTRRQKCGSCCLKFVEFLFSTIGLTCVMVGYTILGGIIFMKLEGPNEEILKHDIQKMRRSHIERLWNMTMEFNVFFEKNWTIEADRILESYTQEVFLATKKKGWDGKNNTSEMQWTFAGSILYSLTVVTTIGYGHIAPKTTWGRVVTIVYAIFGIPLTLLTLTNLGSFMATAFRFLYYNICCGLCCICCPKKERPNVRSATVKYKDAKNGDPSASKSLTREDEEIVPTRRQKVGVRVYWRNGIQRVLKTDDMKTVSVPIYVSLLLMSSYIMLGAVLFSVWEQDWDFMEGSYFCFITLTTIGFGDYVPGTSYTVDSWDAQQKLVLCAMYLIFGLALIVMCFDLMQEEARNKCRYLGRKLGILKKRVKSPKPTR